MVYRSCCLLFTDWLKYIQCRIKSQLNGCYVSFLRFKPNRNYKDRRICDSISATTPTMTLNHLIFGSDSLNQFACLRTKIRVARRISTFACSSFNSPLITLMHSRYPIADMVGKEGE